MLVGSCFTCQDWTQHWEAVSPNHWLPAPSSYKFISKLYFRCIQCFSVHVLNSHSFKAFSNFPRYFFLSHWFFRVCLIFMFVNPPDFFLLPISHFIVVREHTSYIFFSFISIQLASYSVGSKGGKICLVLWFAFHACGYQVLYSKL